MSGSDLPQIVKHARVRNRDALAALIGVMALLVSGSDYRFTGCKRPRSATMS